MGIGSIIMRATIPTLTMVPAGSSIRSQEDVRFFRTTNSKEQNYQKDVLEACHMVRRGYKDLYMAQAQ